MNDENVLQNLSTINPKYNKINYLTIYLFISMHVKSNLDTLGKFR